MVEEVGIVCREQHPTFFSVCHQLEKAVANLGDGRTYFTSDRFLARIYRKLRLGKSS